MLEIKNSTSLTMPKLLVIGIGGSGNNAIDRMISTDHAHVEYIAINTDIQDLDNCLAPTKLQIGMKLTQGFGAGADPSVGEASATESEEDLNELVNGASAVILTCGMGGGTGTGAIPPIAKICREKGILTIAVVTKPFSFEGIPKMTLAESGIEKLRGNVDTLLVIPNDKLLGLSDKTFYLEDAFNTADTVLKHTVDGITNIIYNKGLINLDFNDLRTVLSNRGIGHLGIGIVEEGSSIMDAVKVAIESPLLETDISGASHIMLNTSGKIDLSDLNNAITYIQDIVGEDCNIMWGTVENPDMEGKIVVTLIATGIEESKLKSRITSKIDHSIKSVPKSNVFSTPPQIKVTVPPQNEIVIPNFLQRK